MTIQTSPPSTSLQAMSLNLFAHNAEWPARHRTDRQLQLGRGHRRDSGTRAARAAPGRLPRQLLGDEPHLDRDRRIDYLLVRCGDHGPSLHIADCRRVLDQPVGGVMASDHYGVIADLEPRQPTEAHPQPSTRHPGP